jgi:hypothetical protein
MSPILAQPVPPPVPPPPRVPPPEPVPSWWMTLPPWLRHLVIDNLAARRVNVKGWTR